MHGVFVGLVAAALAVVAPAVARAEGDGPVYRTEVRAGLSFMQPAAVIGAAATWTFPSRVQVGGLLELNPWLNTERVRPSLGATNLGLAVGYHHRIADSLTWRGQFAVGVSLLNQDMLGSNAGTLGVFVDLRLVELLWERPNGVDVVLGAFEIGLPSPQIRGLPILVPQQRLTMGVRF